MKFNCWQENIDLLEKLCKKEGLECSSKVLHTDVEGDTLCEFTIEGQLSTESKKIYQENRVKK